MEHVLQLNEFFVEGGRQEESHVLLHISEPSTPEEKEKGYFFAICEINHAENKYIAEVQSIIDEIENSYYETADEGDKTSLELILEQINQKTYSLVKSGVELHCIIGAIRQPEIIFTYYGDPHLVLFYQTKQGAYQRMNLIEESEGETPGQLFSDIVQGKLSPNDYLFAGTPHISDYFSHDRLEKIITTRPARQSAEHIERVLSELKDGLSFGGLIIHLNRAPESPGTMRKIRPPERETSANSLHSLLNTEQRTANTLSPSLLPRLNTKMKSMWQTPEKERLTAPTARPANPTPEINAVHATPHRRSPTNAKGGSPDYAELLSTIARGAVTGIVTLFKGVAWLGLALIHLGGSLFRNLILLFFVITNIKNRRRTILEDWSRSWRSHRENIRQLPIVTKVLALSSILIGLVFVGSVIYLKAHARTAQRAEAFEKALVEIQTKKEAADSFLIFNDQASALIELQAAKELLANLDCQDSEKNAEECASLESEIEKNLSQARKVVLVTPEVIYDWQNEVNGPLTSVVKTDNALYLTSPSSSAIARYDLLTRQPGALTSNSAVAGFSEVTAPKENDYLLLMYGQRKIGKVDLTTSAFTDAEISFPNDSSSLTSGVVYNRRLYALDTSSGQILRHDSISTGFGQGKPWSKDGNNELRSGISLTVDGDIFVSTAEGTILKFSAGNIQPFEIQGLDPKLGNNTKLWTYNDVTYLYALDTTGKRLLIFEKDGRLKEQITSSDFVNPSDLTVDEPNKAAYIVDGTRLLKVTLP